MNIHFYCLLVLALFTVPASALPHTEKSNPTLTADQSLALLMKGYERFHTKSFRSAGVTKAEIENQGKGQKPHAILLSCSDSRVPPEMIFDQKLGEIFTVRSAGESPDRSQIASIEYAIVHFDTRLIVILGHTRCGAVEAALDTPKGKSAGSPSLDYLVSSIQSRLAQSNIARSPDLHDETLDNAQGIKKDLISNSEIVKKAVESGSVRIVVAIYNLASGMVEFK